MGGSPSPWETPLPWLSGYCPHDSSQAEKSSGRIAFWRPCRYEALWMTICITLRYCHRGLSLQQPGLEAQLVPCGLLLCGPTSVTDLSLGPEGLWAIFWNIGRGSSVSIGLHRSLHICTVNIRYLPPRFTIYPLWSSNLSSSTCLGHSCKCSGELCWTARV